jgi:putative proteasome-type protease
MTYCVAMRVNDGLVFLSDTRTNAGVDQISTFRKMSVFEKPGERVLVLMSAGNLAISQAVCQELNEPTEPGTTVWTAETLHDAARVVGDAVRAVHRRDAESLQQFGVEFNCSFVIGGQIGQQRMRVFQVYAAGNYIEASSVNPYLQIGEAKYGKPIIDRVLTPDTPLDEAAKCALISMDSTLRSNLSVGLPLDLLVYEKDSLKVTRFVSMDHDNQYFQMIHSTWGARLRQVFGEIPDPEWAPIDALPVAGGSASALPPRAAWPGALTEPLAVQSVAQTGDHGQAGAAPPAAPELTPRPAIGLPPA